MSLQCNATGSLDPSGLHTQCVSISISLPWSDRDAAQRPPEIKHKRGQWIFRLFPPIQLVAQLVELFLHEEKLTFSLKHTFHP